MRVSTILVMLSVVSMAMCQGRDRVSFRDSMMGNMLSQGVQATRSSMGSVMNIMSTIGSGMRKMAGGGSGSRRQNNRPKQGRNKPRTGGDAPAPNQGLNDFNGVNSLGGGPNSQNGPQRRRPQRQQHRPQQEEKFVPQHNDGVQRLSGAEINGFASPSSHFKVRKQWPRQKN